MAQNAKIIFQSTGNPTGDGDAIVLDVLGVPTTFTARTNPSASNEFLASSNFLTHVGNLIQAFRALGNNRYSFLIDSVGGKAELFAQFYGEKYNFNPLPSGNWVSITNTVNINDPFTVSHTFTNVVCHGAGTGAIDIIATGGASEKTYLWDNGQTSEDLTNLPPGTYGVTVTEEDGGTASITGIVITEPAEPITITVTKSNVSAFAGTDGTITLVVIGGTPGYTFAWADGPTTQNRTGLAAGTYTVIVTDAGGCIQTKIVNITQPVTIEVEAVVDNGDITLTVIGGVAPYTFAWADGPTTQNRTGVAPGAYTVTVTDSNGVAVVFKVTVSPVRFYFSKNPVTLSLQADNLGTKPNLSFLCEVYVEKEYFSGTFEKVVTLEQPANSDGSTVFDVQPVVDSYVLAHLPGFNQSTVTLAEKAVKRFYLKHQEKYGTPPALSAFTQVNIHTMVLGGLSFEEFAAGTFFDTYLPVQKPFFTWEPLTKKAFADQPEYLYFLPTGMQASFKCKVAITNTDGSSSTQTFHTQNNVHRYDLYCLPAGYSQLNLAAYNPAKTVKSWKVFITDAADVAISEQRTFVLNTRYYAHKRYLLFLSSLGGYNTLVCTGKAELGLDPDSQVTEKVLPANYDATAGEVQVLQKYGKPTLQFSTGYYENTPEAEAIQDFIISDHAILHDGDRYLAGYVADKSAKPVDEDSTYNLLSIDYVLPKMYRYTPKL